MVKRVILLLCALIFLANTTYAQDAMLEWDENSDADYYVVYWSRTPNNFTEENSTQIPADMTFIEMEDSFDGREYYFTVKAFNSCGNSSDFSEMVKTAHLPIEGSVGDAININATVSDIMGIQTDDPSIKGLQADGAGCFIGNAH